MDSKTIPSNQCPMEGSHAVSIELNFELQPWLIPFQTKSNSPTHCTQKLTKYNNEDFFIQLLNAWLHFTNNDFSNPTSVEEILDQPLFLNPHTKLDFSSSNPYFYRIPPNNISDEFNTLRDIFKFFQPGFIFPRTFKEKLNLPTANYNSIYKSFMQPIPDDRMPILKSKTSQESLPKIFYYNNRGIRKVKKPPETFKQENLFYTPK